MSIYAGDELHGDDVTGGPLTETGRDGCQYCDGINAPASSCSCVDWCGYADCEFTGQEYPEGDR